MIILLLVFSSEARIDSLENAFALNRQLETLLQLNECYLARSEYHKSIELLRSNQQLYPKDEDKSRVMYQIGDVLLFAGEIAKAHDTYLRLIGRYPRMDIANDAAQRMYLIEAARDDTVQLKRLINVVRLYETAQYLDAVDSARVLLKSLVGVYAHYYMALAYDAQDELPLSLSTIVELNEKYPKHSIHAATLLRADIYMRLDEPKKAREILEDLIVREPNTIYAFKARQKLELLDAIER
jgi:tetratricopeptide (TPR) repeat protein